MNAVDSYIEALPAEKRKVANQLRELLHSMIPGIVEKFSFKIPFYHYCGGMFCYISHDKSGVYLGVCYGKFFADEYEAMEIKDRAMVASVHINSLAEMGTKQVAEIIATAAIRQEVRMKEKKQKKR
jgi:uncharacterized protein